MSVYRCGQLRVINEKLQDFSGDKSVIIYALTQSLETSTRIAYFKAYCHYARGARPERKTLCIKKKKRNFIIRPSYCYFDVLCNRKLSHRTTSTCTDDVVDKYCLFVLRSYLLRRTSVFILFKRHSSRNRPIGLGGGGGGLATAKLAIQGHERVPCGTRARPCFLEPCA